MSPWLIAQAVNMKLSTPEVIGALSTAAMILVSVCALIDAARHSEKSFAAVGRKKGSWVLWIILTGFFCGPIGLVVSTYYLTMVRPAVSAVDRHGL